MYLASFGLTLWSTTPNKSASQERNQVRVSDLDGAPTKTAANDNDVQASHDPLRGLNTQVIGKGDLDAAKTLLLGVPCSTLLWNFVTASINIILVLCTIDMVYRGPVLYRSQQLSFARVGYVSDSMANLLIREPDVSKLPLYVSYRSISSSIEGSIDDTWKSAGRVYWLSNETDFTHSTSIEGLQESTEYQYAVSNNHTGYFTTAPPSGRFNPRTGKFTFLISSCIKANFPYNPFSHPLSIPGFQHMAQWIPSLKASFMIFLGDFIYVDVPYRFGFDVETYRENYRQIYSSPDWPAASQSLPWIHVMDDHDIANDWDANITDPYPAAIEAYNHYHASVNPPPARPSASYFTFTQGPASFFLLDTRSYRTPSSPLPAYSPEKSMLGAPQLSCLLSFLSRRETPGVHWKFVISSVPFTRNWRFNSADTWAGYLYERDRILAAMWDVGARGDGVGVVVFSGDRHEFAATAFPPPKHGRWPVSATVHEFSTSPLNMFYLPRRTYREVPDEEEICIKYVPDGNSKFGAVELQTLRGGEQAMLRFRLFVDGVESWEHVILSPPAGDRTARERDVLWG